MVGRNEIERRYGRCNNSINSNWKESGNEYWKKNVTFLFKCTIDPIMGSVRHILEVAFVCGISPFIHPFRICKNVHILPLNFVIYTHCTIINWHVICIVKNNWRSATRWKQFYDGYVSINFKWKGNWLLKRNEDWTNKCKNMDMKRKTDKERKKTIEKNKIIHNMKTMRV